MPELNMEGNLPKQQCQPVTTAIEKDDLVIPIIDFGPFLHGTPADKHEVAMSVVHAFKTSGFLYLKDHGVPPSVVSHVFSSSARFFARPQGQKDSLCWTTPQANRGYVKTGQEKLSTVDDVPAASGDARSIPDLKETMEIGREGVDGLPNRWPDHLDAEGQDFKAVMLSFFDMCKALHTEVMRAIALGMHLPEHYFDSYVDAGDNNLRLLHYPAVDKSVFKSNPLQVRAGEHSDYGSITLLFQDGCGGLQVRSPRGTFVDAVPVADTVVVNAGDLLARWSNETIKSTRHRVVEPPKVVDGEDDSSGVYPDRYSIAYFCNPNNDQLIEAIPGTYGEDIRPLKYPGITAGDYLVQRLTATY
ncbi:isopenicillin N synthase family dioxygenase [Aspergillus homomorphus CBS 101889]|uniref:Oxidoreductase n=1 Tax=Aspergillus homomorphus (strain CBS 101889) TaxID=1450537 RepID=A0A395I3J0_ASPHC|nr:oxidoreductase [Aspergillus homomorphus CBS 101889]RAL14650.1 oxidoreductase [Aspergillus homomorphus CBS 101889]